MVQIRHVPEAVHRRLKLLAKEAGVPLSDFLGQEVERIARRPTEAEMAARLAALPPVPMLESAADIIRAGREERGRQLEATWRSQHASRKSERPKRKAVAPLARAHAGR